MEKIDNMVNDLIQSFINELKNQIDNFVYECLIELGYKGDISNLEECKKFVEENKIIFFKGNNPLENFIIISVSCEKLNYRKMKTFSWLLEEKVKK